MTLAFSSAGPSLALAAAFAMLSGMAAAAAAQVAVSANDNKLTLRDGVQTTVTNPAPDTVSVIDLGPGGPRLIGEVRAPASIVGPPTSVAVVPDGSLALVTAAQRLDPATRTLVPDDTVSVIDLRASPIAVIATLHAGAGASGVSVNRAGTLALVANRMAGTVSVFSIEGRRVTAAGTVDLGAPESGPSGVVFTPDGRRALVTRNNDSLISILSVDGTTVAYTKQDVGAGLKPYAIEVAPAGDVAIVGNVGAGTAGGGIDVVNVIDLTTTPTPRVIAHVPAGPVVEGVAISPDGRYVAATIMNGSSSPKSSPLFNDFAILKVFSLSNKTLTPVAEARLGHWCQGAAWNRDATRVLIQCAVERELQVFTFDGRTLTPAPAIQVSGGPSGIRAN